MFGHVSLSMGVYQAGRAGMGMALSLEEGQTMTLNFKENMIDCLTGQDSDFNTWENETEMKYCLTRVCG